MPDPWQSASPVNVIETDPWGATASPPSVPTGKSFDNVIILLIKTKLCNPITRS